MKRKQLWKKIQYISLSGVLLMASPATMMAVTVSAEESVTSAEPVSAAEAPQTDPPQTEPPQTEPPQTDPPQTDPPQTDPPQTDPPQTDPPQTEPPQTETTPTEAVSETTPDTTPEIQESETGGTEGNQSESQTTESETDGVVIDNTEESESESESESETEAEDHSEENANYVTNIIASNAEYLGQLMSAYGISISDDFKDVMNQVEEQFRQKLSDPENFTIQNWKEIFAVFVYESVRTTGSANLTADSAELLLEIFTRMNAPEEALGTEQKEITLEEVFVEEYSIQEDLEQISAQEELLSQAFGELPGFTGNQMQRIVESNAAAQRQAKEAEQKARMDKARYEKWLRLKKEQEESAAEKKETFSSADVTSRTIEEYAAMYGLAEDAIAEIQRYESPECLQLCAIASAAPQIVRASLGNEISEERVKIVTAAYSIVGKVGYFWGGKSYAFGWDPNWGSPVRVTATGSQSSGMTRSYGLDCSGFTLYCYYNGLGGGDAGIGGHTTSQWNASVMVDQASAEPGDLVFYGGPERGDMNHVGLVVGKSSDGGLIVAHCSSSRNGVVVGEAWSSGFRYVRRVSALP